MLGHRVSSSLLLLMAFLHNPLSVDDRTLNRTDNRRAKVRQNGGRKDAIRLFVETVEVGLVTSLHLAGYILKPNSIF